MGTTSLQKAREIYAHFRNNDPDKARALVHQGILDHPESTLFPLLKALKQPTPLDPDQTMQLLLNQSTVRKAACLSRNWTEVAYHFSPIEREQAIGIALDYMTMCKKEGENHPFVQFVASNVFQARDEFDRANFELKKLANNKKYYIISDYKIAENYFYSHEYDKSLGIFI